MLIYLPLAHCVELLDLISLGGWAFPLAEGQFGTEAVMQTSFGSFARLVRVSASAYEIRVNKFICWNAKRLSKWTHRGDFFLPPHLSLFPFFFKD